MENSTLNLESRVWLTPAQAALYTGIGKSRIYELLRSGEIRNAKVGGSRHVRRTDLDDFMEKHVGVGVARG